MSSSKKTDTAAEGKPSAGIAAGPIDWKYGGSAIERQAAKIYGSEGVLRGISSGPMTPSRSTTGRLRTEDDGSAADGNRHKSSIESRLWDDRGSGIDRDGMHMEDEFHRVTKFQELGSVDALGGELPYRERHKTKRDALAAKAAAGTSQPEIVLEGSSVVNDAVDFEDGDVEMEEGEASSSKRKESIDSDSLDQHAGSRRPREGDDSDALSSKRSRGESDTPLSATGALSSPRGGASSSSPRAAQAARDPWMPSASEIADRVGNTAPPNEIPLYVCSGIHDDAVAEEQHFAPARSRAGAEVRSRWGFRFGTAELGGSCCRYGFSCPT
ncbi:hypothetical protein PHYSODRAFT_323108 [Phytophthora sojae]|uniref:Uncharacterized protein n=1 Tax=Phytophthora sojae (strain P6497) TaxID=1094619 RepID=G4YE23_PHYSP|nr:hypothetical protein PHYSODRAFT_323108 [Phytophthora sojae]EGZ29604.1 hypothetical protein PHYSODRAFT_323108 [Phytophthora sojae]|eukprot:XP_009516879.1 hypothetical protein PHYSODRAFT_323108 [Phytophthora sojae]